MTTPDKSAPQDDPGTITFYDAYVPGLGFGNYEIHVKHEVEHVADKAFEASRKFVVSGPQFTLDPLDIHAMFPPDHASGPFADDLPFITLNKRMLPWERKLAGAEDKPWLALLVLDEAELLIDEADLLHGGSSNTRVIETTVGQFLGLEKSGHILTPRITKQEDIPDTQACHYIKLSTATFTAIAPRIEELPSVCHVRKVDTESSTAFGRADDGWYAVIAGNRFPKTAPGGARCIVHLVSLEGLGPYLTDAPVYTASGKQDGTPVFSTLALLSLARWSFTTVSDKDSGSDKSFDGLLAGMLSGKKPEQLWLRRDPGQVKASDAAAQEVKDRISDGYVPMTYRTRSGEDTFAWYRGPLSPVLPALIQKKEPFPSADAALIYDDGQGVFDSSLAAAWQIGRMLALANPSFSQGLLDLRRKVHRSMDLLDERLHSQRLAQPGGLHALSTPQLKALASRPKLALESFVEALGSGVVGRLGEAPMAELRPAHARAPLTHRTDLVKSLGALLDRDEVADLVKEQFKADLQPLAAQLARWHLLHDVPFSHLVPDSAELPVESIRFFYVDPNWTEALLDGALSVGVHSSRDARLSTLIRGLLSQATAAAMRALRERVAGAEPKPAPDGEERLSGILIRSQLVSGWPGLSVYAEDAGKQQLKLLRMEHLSQNVLLCLFLGVPATVRLREPHQGLRLGVHRGQKQERQLELRNVVLDASKPPLGAPLGRFTLEDSQHLRPASPARVLDLRRLVPAVAGALRDGLKAKDPAALSPSDFALQLLKSPEEQIFQAPGAP